MIATYLCSNFERFVFKYFAEDYFYVQNCDFEIFWIACFLLDFTKLQKNFFLKFFIVAQFLIHSKTKLVLIKHLIACLSEHLHKNFSE